MEILTKILEYGGMLRRYGGEVIQSLVNAGRQTGGRYIVAKDALIHYLREKARLRDKFPQHVGDIFLPFGSEGLLVARASAEGDDDDFAFCDRLRTTHEWAPTHQCRSQSHTRRTAQKVAPVAADEPGQFPRIGRAVVHGLVAGAALAAETNCCPSFPSLSN